MSHPLHEVIGDLLAASTPPGCALILDPACRGDQHIPLFCTSTKSFATQVCKVDALILSARQIRLILEIEEADLTPTQLNGKFFNGASASHFIHDRHGDEAIPKGDRVTFIQIVDTSALPVGSSKRAQWQNAEAWVRSFLPLGSITAYKLFAGDEAEFRGQAGQELVETIRSACQEP
jgi:hypothetical protein